MRDQHRRERHIVRRLRPRSICPSWIRPVEGRDHARFARAPSPAMAPNGSMTSNDTTSRPRPRPSFPRPLAAPRRLSIDDAADVGIRVVVMKPVLRRRARMRQARSPANAASVALANSVTPSGLCCTSTRPAFRLNQIQDGIELSSRTVRRRADYRDAGTPAVEGLSTFVMPSGSISRSFASRRHRARATSVGMRTSAYLPSGVNCTRYGKPGDGRCLTTSSDPRVDDRDGVRRTVAGPSQRRPASCHASLSRRF